MSLFSIENQRIARVRAESVPLSILTDTALTSARKPRSKVLPSHCSSTLDEVDNKGLVKQRITIFAHPTEALKPGQPKKRNRGREHVASTAS
jgi:hypothetical protein